MTKLTYTDDTDDITGGGGPVRRGIGAANDYGYFLTLDMENYLPPYGIKLDAGSTQRLAFCVRDNLTTSADTINAIAYGFTRFE